MIYSKKNIIMLVSACFIS